MQTVTIDSQGNTADIKDVSELRRGDRRAVNQAIVIEVDPNTNGPIIRGSNDDDMATAVLRHVVLNWTLPLVLPAKDASVLDKLTLEQDDNLRAAIESHIDAIRGKTAPVKDNETPTSGSAS